jgi:catechol 2,3-dioxygenase-like lactoylglutathione lyase family enzyme
MTARLDAIGIVVDDMARSLAFYRELGVDVPDEADQQPHAEANLPGGPRILWDTAANVRSFAPDHDLSAGGRLGLAFRCDTAADVDATYQRLVSLGYAGRKEPWDAFWGQRYALMADPDGNGVDLYSPIEQ